MSVYKEQYVSLVLNCWCRGYIMLTTVVSDNEHNFLWIGLFYGQVFGTLLHGCEFHIFLEWHITNNLLSLSSSTNYKISGYYRWRIWNAAEFPRFIFACAVMFVFSVWVLCLFLSMWRNLVIGVLLNQQIGRNIMTNTWFVEPISSVSSQYEKIVSSRNTL